MGKNDFLSSSEKKRVNVLYRVSTEAQGTDDDLPTQRSNCESFAQSQGWEIVGETLQKVSGFSVPIEQREDLIEIREKANKKEFDVLLVYMTDRLGRQTEFTGLVTFLQDKGIEVWSAKEGRIGGDQFINQLEVYLKFFMAENESRKTSERVKDSLEQYNKDGLYTGGRPPFGYKLQDTGQKMNSKKTKTMKKLVIDEGEAKIVRLIFDLSHSRDWGGSILAKYLNDEGFQLRGRKFTHSSLTRILRNTVYMGYKRYNVTKKESIKSKTRNLSTPDEWTFQPFDPDIVIIPEEQFKEVQAQMDSRTCHSNGHKPNPRSTKSEHGLLSGLVLCHCGSKLITNSYMKQYKDRIRPDGTVPSYRNTRYRCPSLANNSKHGKGMWGSKAIDSKVEEMVLKVMGEVNFEELDDTVLSYGKKHTEQLHKELDEIEKTLKKKQVALDNANKEMELMMLGESVFSREQIANMMNKVSSDVLTLKMDKQEIIKQLEEKEVGLIDIVAFKEKYVNWVQVYEAGEMEQKQRMLSGVVSKVVLTVEGQIEIYFKIGINEAMAKTVNPNSNGGQVDGLHLVMGSGGARDDSDLVAGKMWGSDQHKWVPYCVTEALNIQDLLKLKAWEFMVSTAG